MSSAVITILGLMRFNPSLFNDLVLPDGVNKDLVIDSIIEHGGDYEVVYPNAELMQSLISSWSKRWLNVFSAWKRATDDMGQINPLDNYDRHETWTDDGTSHSESNDTMSGSGSTSGRDNSSGNGNVTETNKISADDVNDFVNRTQDTQTNETHTSSETSTQSSTNTSNNAVTNGNTNARHEGHIWGNIGVTTSATMYKEFYETMRQYGNIYDSIAITFCQSFVIPIIL